MSLTDLGSIAAVIAALAAVAGVVLTHRVYRPQVDVEETRAEPANKTHPLASSYKYDPATHFTITLMLRSDHIVRINASGGVLVDRRGGISKLQDANFYGDANSYLLRPENNRRGFGFIGPAGVDAWFIDLPDTRGRRYRSGDVINAGRGVRAWASPRAYLRYLMARRKL